MIDIHALAQALESAALVTPHTGLEVAGDARLLRLVIFNLLDNALKHGAAREPVPVVLRIGRIASSDRPYLAVIDQAIRESRAAFLQDPASRFLAVRLARSYTSKLTVLRDMATLPTGT